MPPSPTLRTAVQMLNQPRWLLGGFCVMLFLLARFASVEAWPYTDPKGMLLSAQAIVEHASLDLSPYAETYPLEGWQFKRQDGQYFYHYPIGTSLVALPFVAILHYFGYDFADPHAEAAMSRTLAALSLVIVFLLCFAIARRRAGFFPAFALAAVFCLGTGFFSTTGLALWNLNGFCIAALASFWFLDHPDFRSRPDFGWLLGIMLFIGFIVRPSFALIILAVFTLLALCYRPQFLRAAGISALLLALFLLFSFSQIGRAGPTSYQLSDFTAWFDIPLNLLGHLISPSRGLWVFSPFLLLLSVGKLFSLRGNRASLVGILAAVILCAQLFYLSAWFMWWGGGGFGNRLAVETLPAWFMLFVTSLPQLTGFYLHSQAFRYLLQFASLMAVAIHVFQGGFNSRTVEWHATPDKDAFPEYFWDFRFPQFLASASQLQAMSAEHSRLILQREGLARLSLMNQDSSAVTFDGWEPPQNAEGHRWSLGTRSTVQISTKWLIEQGLEHGKAYRFLIEGHLHGRQSAELRLNAKTVLAFSKIADKQPVQRQVSAAWFLPSDADSLELVLLCPEANSPYDLTSGASQDQRLLGMFVHRLLITESQAP